MECGGDVRLREGAALDFETRADTHAHAHGVRQRSARRRAARLDTLVVVVRVLDVDESPVVTVRTSTPYAAADADDAAPPRTRNATSAANARGVLETAPPGALAHTLRVGDDGGNADDFTFAFDDGADGGGRFAIDRSTGAISTAAALDFEASPRCVARVEDASACVGPAPPPARAYAQHAGPPIAAGPPSAGTPCACASRARPSTAERASESALREVDLRVLDVNEPPWLVDARWKPEDALDRAIDENSAVGTPVGAPILSHDVDADDEHALVYTLEGASAAGLGVSRDEWEAQLEVAGALNYEDPRLGHTRSLTLVATDTDFDGDRDGRGALSARAAITLVLGDVNDPPALASAGVHATGLVIPRDAPQGAEVASLASFVHDEDRDALAYTMVDD